MASVDFREPVRGASKYEPLLIVTLRDVPVRFQDLSHKYGEGRITDLSHHHPQFSGYTYVVHGRDVGFKGDSKSERVLAVSIDYSTTPCRSKKQGTVTHCKKPDALSILVVRSKWVCWN